MGERLPNKLNPKNDMTPLTGVRLDACSLNRHLLNGSLHQYLPKCVYSMEYTHQNGDDTPQSQEIST